MEKERDFNRLPNEIRIEYDGTFSEVYFLAGGKIAVNFSRFD